MIDRHTARLPFAVSFPTRPLELIVRRGSQACLQSHSRHFVVPDQPRIRLLRKDSRNLYPDMGPVSPLVCSIARVLGLTRGISILTGLGPRKRENTVDRKTQEKRSHDR
jgi:hypothetical protein